MLFCILYNTWPRNIFLINSVMKACSVQVLKSKQRMHNATVNVKPSPRGKDDMSISGDFWQNILAFRIPLTPFRLLFIVKKHVFLQYLMSGLFHSVLPQNTPVRISWYVCSSALRRNQGSHSRLFPGKINEIPDQFGFETVFIQIM